MITIEVHGGKYHGETFELPAGECEEGVGQGYKDQDYTLHLHMGQWIASWDPD